MRECDVPPETKEDLKPSVCCAEWAHEGGAGDKKKPG